MADLPSPFLRVDEVARLLRVPVSTIYDWTRRRGPDSIPRYKGGRCLLFDPAEVLNWFRSERRVRQGLGRERQPRRRFASRSRRFGPSGGRQIAHAAKARVSGGSGADGVVVP